MVFAVFYLNCIHRCFVRLNLVCQTKEELDECLIFLELFQFLTNVLYLNCVNFFLIFRNFHKSKLYSVNHNFIISVYMFFQFFNYIFIGSSWSRSDKWRTNSPIFYLIFTCISVFVRLLGLVGTRFSDLLIVVMSLWKVGENFKKVIIFSIIQNIKQNTCNVVTPVIHLFHRIPRDS